MYILAFIVTAFFLLLGLLLFLYFKNMLEIEVKKVTISYKGKTKDKQDQNDTQKETVKPKYDTVKSEQPKRQNIVNPKKRKHLDTNKKQTDNNKNIVSRSENLKEQKNSDKDLLKIKNKNVMIIGGLKKYFQNMSNQMGINLIHLDVSKKKSPSSLKNIDLICFYPEQCSHTAFYITKEMAKQNNVPFITLSGGRSNNKEQIVEALKNY